jgi:hypothetical protein
LGPCKGISRLLGEKHVRLYGREIAVYSRRSPAAIGEAMTKVEGFVRKDTSQEKRLNRIGGNVVKEKIRKNRISVA